VVNLGFKESLFTGTNADFIADSHPHLLQFLGPREEQLLRLFNVFERLFIVRIEELALHANLTKQEPYVASPLTSRGKVKQTVRSRCCIGAGSPPIMVRDSQKSSYSSFANVFTVFRHYLQNLCHCCTLCPPLLNWKYFKAFRGGL
jgi:hypothetical protein